MKDTTTKAEKQAPRWENVFVRHNLPCERHIDKYQ